MLRKHLQKPIAWLLTIAMMFNFLVITGFVPQTNAQKVTSGLQLSYLQNGKWTDFTNSITASSIDGIKIQTSSDSSYYLQYRTWNQGQSGYYPYVKSNINDYAGSSGKPIQRLQIQAYKNDGTKLTSGVVVMYRVRVDGKWLDWVSNADPEWMRSVQEKYNLDGGLDTSASFAGVSTGATISGVEIRVFEEDNISGGGSSGDYSGEGVSPSLSYLSNGSWKSFNKVVTATPIDGIKIQTSSDSSYYLQYRTWNQGQSGYYPYVKSNDNDYAGLSGKPIQRLQIQAYKNDGTKLTSGVVVMYRVLVNGKWLDWVSNADPEWMRSVQKKYNLDGGLDTSASFAGLSTGATISGVEIRVFEEDNISGGGSSGDYSGEGVSPSLSYLSNGSWKSFNKVVTATPIDGIKIQTSSDSSYYLQYRTWNQGQSGYYPYVKSNDNDYAGLSGKPIQRLQIQAYKNDGTKLTSGVVVMYRVLVNGKWLDWVSNADPEWMQSVQKKYNLDGGLDTSASFAGLSTGATISGVEIRVFEENSLNTPTGDYKIIQAPHIYQKINYPTGCESVSTVMALNYAGINISVDSFIDNYLDKSSGVPFDPNTTFGGNPRSSSGYGCYAPVIKKALDKILPGKGYYAKQLSNVSLQELCSQYIDKDIPVIMWATMNMAPPRNGNSWIYNGKKIQWIAPEHCLLLVGYDDNNYIFNDPQRTQPLTYYSKASVEAAYKGLFCQAIVLLPDDNIPVTSVRISPSSIPSSQNFVIGQTRQLTATVSPSNATNKKVTWSTSNSSVATVSSTGLVTAKGAGTANITATTKDGSKKAVCTVTVRHSDPFDPSNIEHIRYTRITGKNLFGGKTDHTISIIKSSLYSEDYFIARDNINGGFSREFVISSDLKNTLNNLERNYQAHFAPTEEERAAHAAKGETDQLVGTYFASGSSEYYGVWAYNYASMINIGDLWEGVINKAAAAYSVYVTISCFYYSYLYNNNSISTTVSSSQYKSLSTYVDDLDNALSGIKYSGKNVLTAESRNAALGYERPPYKPGTPVYEFTPTETTRYVRVYNPKASVNASQKAGRWVMKYSDIQGLTPAQIRDKFALPNIPTRICDVNVPAGTKVYTGVVNEVSEWGKGQGIQFELGQRLDESCFVNDRPLA